MVETFIVRETLKRSDFRLPLESPTGLVILVPIAIIVKASFCFSYLAIVSATAIAIALSGAWNIFRRSKTKEATVLIFPFAIQLCSTNTTKPTSHQAHTLILRQDVIDCIVNEVILAHKIVSVILFRIRDNKGAVQLMQAFPGIELHYRDALRIQSDMVRALNLQATRSKSPAM